MQAVYTVLVKRHSPGTKDAHGNVRDGYSDPEPMQVYGIAPKGSQEPGADRQAVTTGHLLFLPPEAVLGPLDLVLIDGVEHEVEGEVADYTRGPFGFKPGKTASLTKTGG